MIQAKRQDGQLNPHIGCTILNEPFFFPREHWIPAPRDWAKSIVQGKGYSTEEAIGREIWDQVMDRLSLYRPAATIDQGEFDLAGEDRPAAAAAGGLGKPYLTRARLGQGAFRVLVTGAYQRRCAVTGERTLPVLEAAHIKPFSSEGPNHTSNGLLLRSDLHILEFDNGRQYYPLHGQRLVTLPEACEDQPNRHYLAWHNEEVYAG